jgi:uncharacterized protein YggT (Ycf19 family)
MALVDTTDGVFMVGAYGWAFTNPIRKLWYNLTITAVSVVVAFLIGGIEALGLLADKFNLEGGLWTSIRSLNGSLGMVGFIVIGVFVLCWIASALIYRWKRYDELLSCRIPSDRPTNPIQMGFHLIDNGRYNAAVQRRPSMGPLGCCMCGGLHEVYQHFAARCVRDALLAGSASRICSYRVRSRRRLFQRI